MGMKKFGSAVFSIVLLGGFISGAQAYPFLSHAEATENAQEELILSGRTEPYQEVIVSPAMEGKLKDIYKDVGTYVEAGEKLAELDEGDLPELVKRAEDQIKIVEAQGNLTAMEQQIALNQTMASIHQVTAGANILPPEAPSIPEMSGFPELEAAKTAVKDAEIVLAEIKKEWEATNELFESGYIPQQEMEQATAAKTKAELDLEKAQDKVATETKKIEMQNEYKEEKAKYEQEKATYDQKLKSASQQTQVSTQDTMKLQQQSASVTSKMTAITIENAKSELEAVKSQYNKLPILAPVNGFITEKNGRVGEMVSPGNSIFVITNLNQLYVTVNVPEAMVNRWEKDQTVSVHFPTQKNTKDGKVVYVSLMPNSGENTYPVKVIVDNADHKIRAGMQAVVTLKMGNEDKEASTSEPNSEENGE